ncbi:glucosaminidase domain-containing protein [Marinobacter salinisoli]|uniref:Glucosaminidase domain-containing protein n=1 Tax=Marinobacter salinisoli TaxID=2769486 RepID=A0ABX7MQM2_9GAMM|nr:glucosaminidase domain-containing protein [Marinobacter salinisoli]QSP94508.1 glucosaminidase domain-containing protein [Marinobacter salinisoli]
MSSGTKALMLIVPLLAFGVGGGFYSPHEDSSWLEKSVQTQLSLPELPAWADAELPDFSQYRDTTEKKAAFFSFLYPRIVLANYRILLERNYLESLSEKETLSKKERKWLARQADRLRVSAEPGSTELIQQLRHRLDVIPPSLILAQAANESAWGTSRFATKGSNLFGQWCFSRGCGLVPRERKEGARHEVATFESPYRSVRAYIENLNRHHTYKTLRNLRAQNRKDKELSGLELAQGLTGYSERGEAYVNEIRSIIQYNNLSFYDQDFGRAIRSVTPDRLLNMAKTVSASSLLPGQSRQDTAKTES